MTYASPAKSSKKSKAKAKGKDDYQDRLPQIKKNINAAYLASRDNIDRFYEWQRLMFQSTIDPVELTTLKALGRPSIEFNIMNAQVSRLCGEFSKQEPQIYVSAAEGFPADEQLLKVTQGYVKHILFEADKHNYQYLVYRNQMAGGYCNWKVYTDYANDRSFEQNIFLAMPDRPALILYDPCAKKSTKFDAQYWAEPYPKEIDEFQAEYSDIDIDSVRYTSFANLDPASFTWAYSSNTGKQKYLVMVDYYEKKYRKTTLYKLSNGQSMTKQQYEDELAEHKEMQRIEVPPTITDTRTTNICYICRYICIQNQVISYEETDFSDPNYIFVDGDSAELREDNQGSLRQFTRPYCLHALGVQKLTNLSGQAIANDMENMTMHKFMIAQEALPDQEEFLEAYRNVQQASTLVYKKYGDNDPNKPNDPPMPVARVPLPQDVTETFNNCMQMLQNILGSYDASLGIQNKELSGVAIQEGATQSNAAAMPRIVNYMQALNQAAQCIINIMPKYLVTPRTIPIIDEKGQRAFVKINQPGGPQLSYEAGDLHVKVEAGVAFAIAKDRAIKQITMLMQVSPLFAQFINEEGLDILLDNLEFHGVEIVKEKADAFMQKQKQQQQQPNPQAQAAQAALMTAQARTMDAQTNAQKQQADAKQGMYKLMIDAKNMQSTEKEADTDRLKALTGIGESQQQLQLEANKVAAEEGRTRADTMVQVSQHLLDKQKAEHEQIKDIIGMANTAAVEKHNMKMDEQGANSAQD